ncbi:MAG: carboxymuconolactone decarboxylase family protein [Acidimicrobiales bacterium]|nr:carboxymuconolactone decarboxylase family protein [Acidimicrobiales bacterium]
MSRITPRTPDELDPEQRALYDSIAGGKRAQGPRVFDLTASDGSLLGPFAPLLIEPSLGAAVSALGEAIRFQSSLSDRVRELAILVVASHRSSEFEWYAHERLGRHIGLDDAVVDAVRARARPELSEPAELAAWSVVAELVGSRHLGDETFAAAVEHLGERGVFELASLVGYYELLATLMEAFDIGAPGDVDPMFRL